MYWGKDPLWPWDLLVVRDVITKDILVLKYRIFHLAVSPGSCCVPGGIKSLSSCWEDEQGRVLQYRHRFEFVILAVFNNVFIHWHLLWSTLSISLLLMLTLVTSSKPLLRRRDGGGLFARLLLARSFLTFHCHQYHKYQYSSFIWSSSSSFGLLQHLSLWCWFTPGEIWSVVLMDIVHGLAQNLLQTADHCWCDLSLICGCRYECLSYGYEYGWGYGYGYEHVILDDMTFGFELFYIGLSSGLWLSFCHNCPQASTLSH